MEYTVAQVAYMFQVHEDTVRRWITIGELPAQKSAITGRYKIKPEDVDAFREKREQERGQ